MTTMVEPPRLKKPPNDPKRGECRHCGTIIVAVRIAGEGWTPVERYELDEQDVNGDVTVAVDKKGNTRLLRSVREREAGEALHRRHECCTNGNGRKGTR